MERKILWLTWFDHRRSFTLSSELGAVYEVLPKKSSRLAKYLSGPVWTLKRLRRANADVVIVQCPSIGAAVTAILWGKASGTSIVVDFHNAGLRPLEGKSNLLNSLGDWIARNASLCAVTNEQLVSEIARVGGRAMCLPDALPKVPNISDLLPFPVEPTGNFEVVVISSWAADEPLIDLFEAANKLGGRFQFSVTGRPPADLDRRALPRNVRLCGFLSETEYWRQLVSANCVVDLTNRDDCLVCGAYEAIAAEKVVVLSNTVASRAYFAGAALYTDNDAVSIAETIRAASDLTRHAIDQLKRSRVDVASRWRNYFLPFKDALTTL